MCVNQNAVALIFSGDILPKNTSLDQTKSYHLSRDRQKCLLESVKMSHNILIYMSRTI